MRTPLTVATGLLLVAGVVVGVTAAQASSEQAPPIRPIRVEAPAADPAVAAETTGAAVVPVLPETATAPAPRDKQAPQQQAPRQQTPRDPDGSVAPPPADDDDDDGDDDAGDDDDDGAGDD